LRAFVIGVVSIALSIFLAWQAPVDAAGLQRVRFEHDGIDRRVLVFDPKAEGPRPLVIMLHGGMSMAGRGMRQSKFNQIAREEGFIVAYPDGTGPNRFIFHSWNARHCCGGPASQNVDDVGFVEQVIDRLVAEGRVDPDRVYVTGFSAGGMLAQRIGVELSDKVAAIAPVAGAMFGDEPAPKAPLSVMMIRYAGDNVVPAVGPGPGVKRGFADRDLISVRQAGDYWGKAGGCGPAETSRGATFEKVEWKACRPGVQVMSVTVDGGRHAWPGEKLAGYAASWEIWNFFKDRRRVSPRAGSLEDA